MTTLLLSKNTKDKNAYYLTSLTNEEKETLYTAKAEGTLKDLTEYWGIHCEGITKVGITEDITPGHLAEFVESFPGYTTEGINNRFQGRPKHYRFYGKTLKQQQDIAWLINICEDTSASVRSAIKQMPDEYTILWEVPIGTFIDEKMDKLLKDKVKCKIFN